MDVSILSDAALDAATDAGATIPVVTQVSKLVVFRDTTFNFYMADLAAPPAQGGLRVVVQNKEFVADYRLADISGPGAANALTAAERVNLVKYLRKIFGNKVLP